MFNRWGDDGCTRSGDMMPERRTEKTGVLTTEVVAHVIRSLGYIVTCSAHPYSGTGWAGHEGGCYIIMSIQSQDGKYIYGCSRKDEKYNGHRVETRPLLGHRTIWDWAGWQARCTAGRELCNAEDLKSFICEDDIIRAIDCGATAVAANLHHLEYDRIQFDVGSGPTYVDEVRAIHENTGISTIGNVLPSDIVEALRDFRHDDSAFRTEADWEFYMGVMVCPVAEEADCVGGAAAASGAAPAAAASGAAGSADGVGSTDGSDSSSDEDDA